MSKSEYSFQILSKRLFSDLSDGLERQYYGFWLISQIPCAFGDMLRARYCCGRFKKAGYNLKVLAGTRFRSIEKIEVGDNVTIGHDNYIQARGGVTIGDNVLLGPGVKIWSTNHLYKTRNIPIVKQGLEDNPVVIGNDIWLCSNVFVTPGVKLPDGIVAAAGSILINQGYKPYTVYGGNPARIIGVRS